MRRQLALLADKLNEEVRLPMVARRQRARDRRGLLTADPGIDASVSAAVDWLCRAQDHSASGDGGVARDYSLLNGWATSYPETTGYIVPTIIDVAVERADNALRHRARRMLDWMVSIQFPEGGFQGGKIEAVPRVPVTFNTGQILLGLARGVVEFGDTYREPTRRAAQWLVDTQDPDGCWRRHPTPFADPGEKTYETHVAWGLLEAARVMPEAGFAEAGLRNVYWALTKQRANGWFADCCLTDPARPLTHTIGYALRGIVEAWRYSGEDTYLAAARRTADALVSVIDGEGFLPGRLTRDWTPAVSYCCLTGSVQIAHSLLLLSGATRDSRYQDCARRLNRYVRRTIQLEAEDGIRGGVKGSFPIDGEYGRFEYLNWAAKFFIDANRLEAATP